MVDDGFAFDAVVVFPLNYRGSIGRLAFFHNGSGAIRVPATVVVAMILTNGRLRRLALA